MHIKRLLVFLSSIFPSSGIGSFFDSIFWYMRIRFGFKIIEKCVEMLEIEEIHIFMQRNIFSWRRIWSLVLVNSIGKPFSGAHCAHGNSRWKCNASSSFRFMPKWNRNESIFIYEINSRLPISILFVWKKERNFSATKTCIAIQFLLALTLPARVTWVNDYIISSEKLNRFSIAHDYSYEKLRKCKYKRRSGLSFFHATCKESK